MSGAGEPFPQNQDHQDPLMRELERLFDQAYQVVSTDIGHSALRPEFAPEGTLLDRDSLDLEALSVEVITADGEMDTAADFTAYLEQRAKVDGALRARFNSDDWHEVLFRYRLRAAGADLTLRSKVIADFREDRTRLELTDDEYATLAGKLGN